MGTKFKSSQNAIEHAVRMAGYTAEEEVRVITEQIEADGVMDVSGDDFKNVPTGKADIFIIDTFYRGKSTDTLTFGVTERYDGDPVSSTPFYGLHVISKNDVIKIV